MFKKMLFVICCALFAENAFAAWDLANEASLFGFVSIKKSSVAEVHQFGKLSGEIDDDGHVTVDIDLSSVETGIPLRNSRMKSYLFEVGKFHYAHVTGTVSPSLINGLGVGRTTAVSVPLKLSLHGKTRNITAAVFLFKQEDGAIMVGTGLPIIVNAKDYGLGNGIERLARLAKLPRIATAVPVTFTLTFRPHSVNKGRGFPF